MGDPGGVDPESGLANAGLTRKQYDLAIALLGAGPAAGDDCLLVRASIEPKRGRRHDLRWQWDRAVGRWRRLPLDQTGVHRVGHALEAEFACHAEPVPKTADQPAHEIRYQDLSRRRGAAQPGGLHDGYSEDVVILAIDLAARRADPDPRVST